MARVFPVSPVTCERGTSLRIQGQMFASGWMISSVIQVMYLYLSGTYPEFHPGGAPCSQRGLCVPGARGGLQVAA